MLLRGIISMKVNGFLPFIIGIFITNFALAFWPWELSQIESVIFVISGISVAGISLDIQYDD